MREEENIKKEKKQKEQNGKEISAGHIYEIAGNRIEIRCEGSYVTGIDFAEESPEERSSRKGRRYPMRRRASWKNISRESVKPLNFR